MTQGFSLWCVDACPAADGSWTIRLADHTPHGNTEVEPIAYGLTLECAECVVNDHNALLEIMKAFGVKSYTALVDRALNGKILAHAGDTLYPAPGPDYGLSRDDTASTGIPHITVTHDPSQWGGTFTMPVGFLKEKV